MSNPNAQSPVSSPTIKRLTPTVVYDSDMLYAKNSPNKTQCYRVVLQKGHTAHAPPDSVRVLPLHVATGSNQHTFFFPLLSQSLRIGVFTVILGGLARRTASPRFVVC